MTNVHDIDLVYFDDQISFIDSVSNDKQLEKSLSEKFPYRFDVHNEAYMHLWQNSKKFHTKIPKMLLSVGLLLFMQSE